MSRDVYVCFKVELLDEGATPEELAHELFGELASCDEDDRWLVVGEPIVTAVVGGVFVQQGNARTGV